MIAIAQERAVLDGVSPLIVVHVLNIMSIYEISPRMSS